jgi:hypothetical protein
MRAMFPQQSPFVATIISDLERTVPCSKWLRVSCLLLAAFSGGCAQKDEFVQTAADRPHAIVTVATGVLFAPGPIVSSINGQPPSRWRYREEYRINPGPTKIRVVAERQPFEYGTLEFTAAAGHSYEIRRVFESAGEFAAIYESAKDSATPQLVTRAPRIID